MKSSKYCEKCQQDTPIMYYEGGEFCMYCQTEYPEKEKKEDKKDENEA